MRAGTNLLSKPFTKARFDFVLGKRAVDACVFQPAANFVENVEMVLDILDRGVVWQLTQQRFDILLSSAHEALETSIALPKVLYTNWTAK